MPVGVPIEKASLGNNGDSARRSMRTIAISAASAPAISAALASGVATMAADEVPAMARQMSATRSAGTRGGGPLRSGGVGGKARKAPSASTAAIAATATK